MPPFPSLDHETLVRLRELVAVLHDRPSPAVPVVDLVKLAQSVRLNAGLTVDFDASRTLGQPMVVLRVSGGGTATEPFDDSLCSLSKREIEVSSLVSAGLSNKQIAKSLFLSLATVKDHVHRILSKTGLANRAAIAAAYQKRLTAG